MSSSSRLRTGGHRPRRRPGAVVLPLVIVVAAGLVGLRLVSRGGAADGAPAAGPAASGARTPGTSSAPFSAPDPTGPPSGGASASPTSATAAGDRSAPVTVLNATRRPGLATRAATALRSAGWLVARTGNYRQPPPVTTVYYSGAQLRATARALSADLPGVQRVERSSQFGDAVTIVLGPDFSG